MKKKSLTSAKAKLILADGTVRGHKLTDKQRRFFGYIAGGKAKKKKKGDGYTRVVDNKMKDYGETDEKKKIVRIRKKPFKSKKWKKGEVLNTIVHEEMHVKHPKMKEKTVYKKTESKIKKMPRYFKNKQYAKYRKSIGA